MDVLDVEICNRALFKIGSRAILDAPENIRNTNEGIACDLIYESELKKLISRYNWNCFTEDIRSYGESIPTRPFPADLTDPQSKDYVITDFETGYFRHKYKHDFNNNAIHVIRILKAAVRIEDMVLAANPPDPAQPDFPYIDNYGMQDIRNDPNLPPALTLNDNKLWCDYEQLLLRVLRIPQPSVYIGGSRLENIPAYFISCFERQLAAELCITFRDSDQKYQVQKQLAEAEFQEARTLDYRTVPQDSRRNHVYNMDFIVDGSLSYGATGPIATSMYRGPDEPGAN